MPAPIHTLYQAFRRAFVFANAGSRLAQEHGLVPKTMNDLGYVGKQLYKHDTEGSTKQAALEAGFYDPETGHNRTKNALVFPRYDRDQQIVGLSFYPADGTSAIHLPETAPGFYPGIPSPETETLILTPDVLTTALWLGVDFPMTTAVFTLSNDPEWTAVLYELSDLRELICLWSEDDPNYTTATDTCRLLTMRGISVRHVYFTESWLTILQREGAEGLAECLHEQPFAKSNTPTDEAPAYQLDTRNPQAFRFTTPHDLLFTCFGGISTSDYQRLQVTLSVSPTNREHHWRYSWRESINLYDRSSVGKFIEHGAGKTGVSRKLFSEALDALTDALENIRINATEPEPLKIRSSSDPLRREARTFLSHPDLMSETLKYLSYFIAGEDRNKLLLYLILTSRLLQNPLSAVVMGPPASGKTHLIRSVIDCFPENETLSLSLCANSLFFFEDGGLKNKILWLEDAEYAPKKSLITLQELKRGVLTKPVPQKNLANGSLYLQNYTAEGPVVTVSSASRRLPEFEYALILSPDVSAEQDEKVLQFQRLQAVGQYDPAEGKRLRDLLRAAQSVLQNEPPVAIRNPFAHTELPFTIPGQPVRRVHYWWLKLAETVCLYHRLQRKVERDTGGEFISVTESDLRWTNELLSGLGTAEVLSPAANKLLEQIKNYLKVNQSETFKSADLKKKYGLNTGNLKRWLKELLESGAIAIKDGNAATGYTYTLEADSFAPESTPEEVNIPDNQVLFTRSGSVAHEILTPVL